MLPFQFLHSQLLITILTHQQILLKQLSTEGMSTDDVPNLRDGKSILKLVAMTRGSIETVKNESELWSRVEIKLQHSLLRSCVQEARDRFDALVSEAIEDDHIHAISFFEVSQVTRIQSIVSYISLRDPVITGIQAEFLVSDPAGEIKSINITSHALLDIVKYHTPYNFILQRVLPNTFLGGAFAKLAGDRSLTQAHLTDMIQKRSLAEFDQSVMDLLIALSKETSALAKASTLATVAPTNIRAIDFELGDVKDLRPDLPGMSIELSLRLLSTNQKGMTICRPKFDIVLTRDGQGSFQLDRTTTHWPYHVDIYDYIEKQGSVIRYDS